MYSTVLILLFGLGVILAKEVGPTILHTLDDGGLHGLIKYTSNDTTTPVFTFLGIPYAAPPVNDLRFKPPLQVKPWRGVRDATKMPAECPQDRNMWKIDETYGFYDLLQHAPMSEDCLYLNVYTPTLNPKAKLPVMVFIHGGGLVLGSVWMTNGVATASHGNVVSVVINYRLGPFGLLTTFDEDAPGNVGFLDQIMALKWVQKNIAAFGGDPEQVLIYGESAGSWSVNALIISPLGEGLFKRAIGQSGSLTHSSGLVHSKESGRLQKAMDAVVKQVGCENKIAAEVMSCLRSKPAMDLIIKAGIEDFMAFGPTYGYADSFFPEAPNDLITKPDLKKRLDEQDIMFGVTENEGISYLRFMMDSLRANKTLEAWFSDVGMVYTNFLNKDVTQEMWDKRVGPAMQAFYLPMENPTYKDMAIAATRVGADAMLSVPTIKTLQTLKEMGANVYGYEFALGPTKARKKREDYLLCDHGEDLAFMVGLSMMQDDELSLKLEFEDDDFEMERLLFNYWLNFAKTGNPNGPNLPNWPKYESSQGNVLSIQLDSEVKNKYLEDAIQFWLEDIPKIINNAKSETYNDEL